MTITQVVLDTRDPIKLRDKIRAVLLEKGIPTVDEQLPAGDILIVNRHLVGVERKTSEDLISSITGRGRKGVSLSRLADELNRLKEAVQIPILLITGRLWCSIDGWVVTSTGEQRMRYSTVSGVLRSIQHDGILLDYCPNPARLPMHVLELCSYYAKEEHTFMNDVPTGKPTEPDRRYSVLSDLGVGHDRATPLFEKYGSLLGVLANVESWTDVKGIGPLTVAKAKEVLL